MLDSNIPENPLRPGIGVPQGTVQTISTALSSFQVVRTLPTNPVTFYEMVRINIIWIPAGTDNFQIGFGPSSASLPDLVGAPTFTAGIQRFLLLQTDTGFKIKSTGADTDNLYWFIG